MPRYRSKFILITVCRRPIIVIPDYQSRSIKGEIERERERERERELSPSCLSGEADVVRLDVAVNHHLARDGFLVEVRQRLRKLPRAPKHLQ